MMEPDEEKPYIFVIGGNEDDHRSHRECEMYDVISDKWSPIASMIQARTRTGAVVCSKRIYVTGGEDLGVADYFSSVELYDPFKETWTLAGDLKNLRSSHGTAVLNGSVYVAGGYDGQCMLICLSLFKHYVIPIGHLCSWTNS